MERKFLLLKTSENNENHNGLFFSEMCQQFSDILAKCSENNSTSSSILSPKDRTASYCSAPSKNWTPATDTSLVYSDGDVYTHSDDSLSNLATCLHTCLDRLPSPGTHVLTVLWLCDTPPVHPSAPMLGALERAVTWHGASVVMITRSEVTSVPAWLSWVRTEMLPQPYLCDCHGLQEFISSTLVWQGSLAFYDTEMDYLTLPGFELHTSHDHLEEILQKISPATDVTSKRNVPRYFSSSLEVVSEVPVTSVLSQPQYLTSERLELSTALLEGDGDGLASQFMSSGFDNDTGYIVKLKYSYDKPKHDPTLLKTDSWKQKIINCNFSREPPCSNIGVDVASINILIYDNNTEDGDCSRVTNKKSAIVLKNANEIQNIFTLKQSLSKQEATEEDIEKTVVGLQKFSFDEEKLSQLKKYIRNVQAKVIELLQENQSQLLKLFKIDDILIAIQEEILKQYDNVIEADGHVTTADVAKVCNENLDKNENVSMDEWQELRFLKYLSLHSEREEQEKVATSKLMKPSDEEFVVLEAKELIKYFDKNGLPAKDLEPTAVKTRNCPLRPQKSEADYTFLMSEHFDNIPQTDYSFKGLRYREEKDFSAMEFTQYHDVYYNTGTVSEKYDLDSKNYRDCMIGPHRETKSTFSSGDAKSTRLKVPPKKPVVKTEPKTIKQERRTSPRKKVGPLQNFTNKKPISTVQVKRESLEKSDSGLNSSKNSDKGAARKKSVGDPAPPGELTEINRKKLRVAVYNALQLAGIEEKNPLFRKCFPKLFNICKMYVIEGADE